MNSGRDLVGRGLLVSRDLLISRGLLVSVLLGLAFAAPTLWILPSVDDWGTIRPHVDGLPPGALRPGVFFRPIEQLLRLVAGRFPEWNGAWMHGWTVLGHLLSVGFLYSLLQARGRFLATIVSGLFATSASMAAAVWSLDSAIQTWSTACGLFGLWLYLSGKRKGLWLPVATLALMWKESGVVWLLLTPLLAHYLSRFAERARWTPGSRRTSTLVGDLARGLAIVVCYLLFRHVAGGDRGIPMGQDRYGIHLNPLIWAKHATQLGVVAVSVPDTIALFGDPRAVAWGAASLVTSAPLILLCAWAFLQRHGTFALLWGIGLVVLSMGPHLVLGHVSEMYAHPIAATACLTFAWPPDPVRRTFVRTATVLFVCTSLVVSVHKGALMIQAGQSADEVGDELAQAWGDRPPPASVCLSYPTFPAGGYSVFQATPAKASGFGRVLYSKLGFRSPREFTYGADRAACATSLSDAMIWFEDPTTPRIEDLRAVR